MLPGTPLQLLNLRRIGSKLLFACLILWSSAAVVGQNRAEEDQDYSGGSEAGGKWMQYGSQDRMTGAKKVRFLLPAEHVEQSDDRAKIVLFCTDGKLNLADFRPNIKLSRPNWPGFWGQPQMHVLIRVDNSHSTHSWNWVNGHFLAMDKGTARELIGAHLFRVEFQTPEGPEIAEFSPAGLELGRVETACGLKPKKP